jgi:hypothetical protein
VGQCIYNFGEKGIDYLPDCFCEAHFRKRALAHGKPLIPDSFDRGQDGPDRDSLRGSNHSLPPSSGFGPDD